VRPAQEGAPPGGDPGVAAPGRLPRGPGGLQPAQGIDLRPHRLRPAALRPLPPVRDGAVAEGRDRAVARPRRGRQGEPADRHQRRDEPLRHEQGRRPGPEAPGRRRDRGGEEVAHPAGGGKRRLPEPPMRATRLAPLALVLPSVLLVVVFVYGFIAWTAWLSLSNANDLVVSPVRLVGFANYRHLAELPRFRIDLGNTVMFSLAFIAGCLGLGLGGALLVNS